MWFGEVNIPQELITAQDEGELVVFAGAGVSMGPPANLPNYRTLAELLAKRFECRYDKVEHPDQFIGKIVEKHRETAREYVRGVFANDTSKPTDLHRGILRLFTGPEKLRIVTTNYDTLFEQCANGTTPHNSRVFCAPALPVGDRFKGVVHVHGSTEGELSDMVLTDADFGIAYLTEGWARRFLVRLFTEKVTLFIGYSHDDLMLRYMAKGLVPGSRRYALVPSDEAKNWRDLRVETCAYPLDEGDNKHIHLVDAIKEWGDLATMSFLDHESRVKRITEEPDEGESDEVVTRESEPYPASGQILTPDHESYLVYCLKDEVKTPYFTRSAKGRFWLEWLDRHSFLDGLFVQGKQLKGRESLLARWFAINFVCSSDEYGLTFLEKKGKRINSILWLEIARSLAYANEIPAPNSLAKWISALISNPPTDQHEYELLGSILNRNGLTDDYCQAILPLFAFLTRPRLELEKRLSFRDEDSVSRVSTKAVSNADDFPVKEAWEHRFKPMLPRISRELAVVFTAHLRLAYSLALSTGLAKGRWDPISSERSAIEEHTENWHRSGMNSLIDYARDMIEWLLRSDYDYADSIRKTWERSGVPILERFAVHAVKASSHLTADQKLEWLLDRDWLYRDGLKHEVSELLKHAFPAATQGVQARVIERAEKG